MKVQQIAGEVRGAVQGAGRHVGKLRSNPAAPSFLIEDGEGSWFQVIVAAIPRWPNETDAQD